MDLTNCFRWAWPRQLRRRGILGINRRNAVCVLPLNPRARYPLVDDKLRTKQVCRLQDIPVPETYAVVRRHGDVRRLETLLVGREQFVVKPAEGSEGRGIIVVSRSSGGTLETPGGARLTWDDLRHHTATVLSGLYSLAGQADSAIVEQRILPHPLFEGIALGGTPDLRIVLYRHVPVMAMLRLPTRASRGRANLHQGAVAAGVDLVSGKTLGGVCKNRAVAAHPDTGEPIQGRLLPDWEALLMAAMRLADGLELGYLGVDFVLDAARGPVVLEANARPGLAIQVANRCGLLPRLRRVDERSPGRTPPGPGERMALVRAVACLA